VTLSRASTDLAKATVQRGDPFVIIMAEFFLTERETCLIVNGMSIVITHMLPEVLDH